MIQRLMETSWWMLREVSPSQSQQEEILRKIFGYLRIAIRVIN